MPTEQDVANEGRLTRIEGKVDALSKRLEEMFVSQIQEHEERIGEQEKLIQALRVELAELRGHRAGSKAMLMLIITIIGVGSGVFGVMIGRSF